MRLPQNSLRQAKAWLHGLQTVLAFVTGCLTLSIMAKSGGHGGETNFYFALCFLTIPAVAYLVIVPMWSRLWRLNSVYAYAVVDVLFCILWFAASVAVAVWNASKPNEPSTSKQDDSNKNSPSKIYACGSAARCAVSKASVGLGLVLCLLFATTSYISICALIEYRKTGVKPHIASTIQQTYSQRKAAHFENDVWSSNADNNRASIDALNSGHDEERGKSLLRQSGDDGDLLPHPGRRTSYHSEMSVPPLYDPSYAAPSALSPGIVRHCSDRAL